MPEGMDLGFTAFPDHILAEDLRRVWIQATHRDNEDEMIAQYAPTNRYTKNSVIGKWAEVEESHRMRLYYDFGYIEYRKVPKP